MRLNHFKAFVKFCNSVEEEKEGRRKLAKRKRKSDERNKEDRLLDSEDRLSDLPDAVLLHILEFLPTKQAVQSCVLSKQWKNLWKSLSTLSFKCSKGVRKYNTFVSHVLSNRDHSIALHNLHFKVFNSTAPKLLSDAINYAALHHLQKLTLDLDFKFQEIPTSFVPLLYNCKYLTFLEIFITSSCCSMQLPESLELPSLKTLVLSGVTFTGRADNCAEPFSACTSLTTLVLRHSMLNYSAQTLHISCPSLSTLKLDNIVRWYTFVPKIVLLSVPNLSSITFEDCDFSICYELSSTCDLPFLGEVKIKNRVNVVPSIIIDWLRMFSNVRTLTLCSRTLYAIMKDLQQGILEIEPPHFPTLELFKVDIDSLIRISEDEQKKVVEYLVRNCDKKVLMSKSAESHGHIHFMLSS